MRVCEVMNSLIREAREPSTTAAWFVLGYRPFSELMGEMWRLRPTCEVLDEAYGYFVELDENAHPDEVRFVVNA